MGSESISSEQLVPSSSTSTNQLGLIDNNNKRRRNDSAVSEILDNIINNNNQLPTNSLEKPPTKKKAKRATTPKVYSNILPHDFYDKLNIYGQHVFILTELERESNYLNTLHKKLSEQVHKLQIEESVMKRHFDALYRHQQEEEEQKQRDEYGEESSEEESELNHHGDIPYAIQDFTKSYYGQPENIMSTEQIRYAPDLNQQQREDVVRNMKTSLSTTSTTNNTDYEKVPEVVSKEFLALRNYLHSHHDD